MGRTRVTRKYSKEDINDIDKRKNQSIKRKRDLIKYLEKLKKSYKQGKISYAKYVETIHKKRNGRTIEEWIHYYHLEALECHRIVHTHKKKSARKKHLVFIAASILFIFLISLFVGNLAQVGLVTYDENVSQLALKDFSQDIGLDFTESTTYELELDNPGQIDSLSLSGLIQGDGQVKVYLDDLLIIDNSQLKETKSRTITALAVGEINEEEEEQDEESSEPAAAEVTEEEEIEEESSQQEEEDSSPSLDPSQEGSSEDSPPTTRETPIESPIIEEEEEETNETTEIIEESEDIAEETNQTQIEINQTEEESAQIEDSSPSLEDSLSSNIQRFSDICIETCDIGDFEFNQSSYTLTIEISNATLTLEEVNYRIITIIPKEEIEEVQITEMQNATNATVSVKQFQAVVGQPVKWKKTIKLDQPGSVKVSIPKNAENITATKRIETPDGTRGASAEIKKQKANIRVTGMISALPPSNNPIITRFFKNIFSTITGRAITEETLEVEIDDNATEYELIYYTEAPQSSEEAISKGKRIIITGPDNVHYEDILAFSELEQEVALDKITLYHLVNDSKQEVDFDSYDLNENGLIDYIEWIVPHLSEQQYEIIIEIISADHLDENKVFIKDIYNETYQLDDVWSEPIKSNEYVRITFEQNLTSTKDITLYAKGNKNNIYVEVYEYNSSELIATFPEIRDEGYYKIYLTNLTSEFQDTFDLKVIGNNKNSYIEVDHIIDPTRTIQAELTLTSATHAGRDVLSSVNALDNVWYLTDMKDFAKRLILNFSDNLSNGTILKVYVRKNKGTIVGIFAQSDTAGTNPLGNFTVTSVTGEWKNITLNNFIAPTRSIWLGEGIFSSDPKTDFDYITATTPAAAPTVTLISPANASSTSNSTPQVTWNVTDAVKSFTNCTGYFNNGTTYPVFTRLNVPNATSVSNSTNRTLANGIWKWWVVCNNGVLNGNSVNRTLTIDTIGPEVAIANPKNKTYNQHLLPLIVDFASDAQSCWYSLNGNSNISFTCGSSLNITAQEGGNNIRVYSNDTLNNIGSNIVYFNVNSSLVLSMSIIYPANGTYTNDPTPEIKLLAVDELYSTIYYTLYIYNNTGLYSIGNTGTLVNNTQATIILNPSLTLIGDDTDYRIIAVANDTVNYANSSVVYIYLTTPTLDLISPENGAYDNDGNIDFTFKYESAGFPTANCSLYLNGIYNKSNATTNSGINTALNVIGIAEGQNQNWSINCSMGSVSIKYTRTFNVDKTNPSINIMYPQNTTYIVNVSELNYTYSDANPEFCWYSKDNGATNSSAVVAGTNFTDVVSVEGSNTWVVYCNDSAGNKNSSSVAFNKNTGNPQWSNPSKNETTVYSNQSVNFNATWTNTQLAGYIFSINQSGTWINSSYIPFSGTTNVSENISTITADAGTNVTWYFWANDTAGDSNQTDVQSFVVQSRPTTLTLSTDNNTYPQGRSPGQGYDPYIIISARYLDNLGNPIPDANCTIMDIEHQDGTIHNLVYNVSSGNYTFNHPTFDLSGTVIFNATCSKTNYDTALNSTSANIWFYNYLWEHTNQTYDGGLWATTYLRKEPITNGTLYIKTYDVDLVEGVNLIDSIVYCASSADCSFVNSYLFTPPFTMRMNMSINDTTCKPILCKFDSAHIWEPVHLDCGDEVNIPANTPTLVESNYTGNETRKIDSGFYMGTALYLNCSSNVSEQVKLYYNYTNEPANLIVPSAQRLTFDGTMVDSYQLDPTYILGPNMNSNSTRRYIINFNNSRDSASQSEYIFLSRILAFYPNSISPNTTYVYNSTGGLLASDNASANPSSVAIVSNVNQISWTTESIPAYTSINETVDSLFLDSIQNTETISSNTSSSIAWNITITSILIRDLQINDLVIWSNYSAYGVDSNWNFTILKYTTGAPVDITSECTINSNNGTIYLPNVNVSREVYYTITANDITPPTVHLISPANNSNVDPALQNFSCNISNVDIANLSLLIWNSTSDLIYSNTTDLTGVFNQTSWEYTLPYGGSFKWNCLGYDTSGYSNYSSEGNYTITLDRFGPNLTIINPKYETYNVYGLTLSIDADDAEYCWYSLNGLSNVSFVCGDGANITANEGYNNITVYANDTFGNLGSDFVSFIVDTTLPLAISIISPANNTLTNGAVPVITLLAIAKNYPVVNYTLYIYYENGTLYSIGNTGTLINNTATPITLSPALNLIGNLTTYRIIAAANDGVNYTNSSELTITLTTPSISLLSPAYGYSSQTGDINFTFSYQSDDFPTANCSLYLNDIYNQTNESTLENTPTTFIVTGIPQGANQNWTVNCTMTGASVKESRIFHVDTTPPTISINSPLNQTYYTQSILVNISASDSSGLSRVWYNWNGTNITYYTPTSINFSEGSHTLYAYANDTAGNVNSTSITFNVIVLTPPNVEILYPIPDALKQINDYIGIMANITDPDGVNSSIAQINLPNNTQINVTLAQTPPADNFDSNTLGVLWEVENTSVASGQTCIADIDTTVTDKAYTSISGDGSPNSEAHCSLVMTQQVVGDFDLNVSFNMTQESGIDYTLSFKLTEVASPITASKMIFMTLQNWTGYGRAYGVFAIDGNLSGAISMRETGDTFGKLRIKRVNNTFTFYTYNNSNSSWIQEAESEINIYPGLFITLEADSGEENWGNVSVAWDDLNSGISPLLYVGSFTETSLEGDYNITIFANDSYGAVNNTEKTNFTIQETNDAPSPPLILTPVPNAVWNGTKTITWSQVYDDEDDTVQFNITLLNPDLSFNSTIASNYGNSSSTSYSWDTTTYANGNYSLRVTVFENSTVENYSVSNTLLGNFTISNNFPPSVVIEHPHGESFDKKSYVPIIVNVSDLNGISTIISEITLPNETKINITLGAGQESEDFNTNSMDVDWEIENSTIGPGQTCIADINTTAIGAAYTSISGDGSPNTDTYCSILSKKAVAGDFDISISFNATSFTGSDMAINFVLTEKPTSIVGQNQIFMSLSNWAGSGKEYQLYAIDQNFSDYVSIRDTNDTHGKFRITRVNNTFTFYTWNNTASSWFEENMSEKNFSLNKALYLTLQSETASTNWGTASVDWDNLTINSSNQTFGMFSDTNLSGNYNLTIFANDSLGTVNNTEKSNFTILFVNNRPSPPFILSPTAGEILYLTQNIVWSQVYDEENDNVNFNITLLNPNGSDNATIVSNYGNINSTNYVWNTSAFADGNYDLRITVFENETAEANSNSNTLGGNFTIDNTPPTIDFVSPTETSGTTLTTRNNIQVNVTASGQSPIAEILIYLYNSTDLINTTSIIESSNAFVNFTNLSDGIYYFNASAVDTTEYNTNSTETRNVTISTTPTIILNASNGAGLNYTSNITASYGNGIYDINLTIYNEDVSSIFISRFNTSGCSDLVFESNTNETFGSKDFAINTDCMIYSNLTLRVKAAVADHLYKCSNWSMSTLLCNDENSWEVIDFLSIGVPYDIILTPGDPGFIELNVSNIDILEDGTADESNPTEEYGARVRMEMENYTGTQKYSLINFNLTKIPAGVIITNATLTITSSYESLEAGNIMELGAYHVYQNFIWTEGTGGLAGNACTGNEFCWNYKPNATTQYNTTPESRLNATNNDDGKAFNFSVANMIKTAYENSENNISIYVIPTGNGENLGTSDDIRFHTKEAVTEANRPRLNISYTYPPQITYVSPIANTNPVEASSTPVTFYTTMYDLDGVADLNDTSVNATFTRNGQPTRSNSTCLWLNDIDANSANYSCTIDMWYFDEAGDWNITVSGKDSLGINATNTSTYFQYNQLQALVIGTNNINFNVSSGTFNQSANNDPVTINNTGNYNITNRLAINAINLLGETISSESINAENFSANIVDNCAGPRLNNATDTNITGAVLEAGNLSLGGGVAQEEIYYCINEVGLISSQTYSTQAGGAWIIKIVLNLAIITTANKSKKKKKKQKRNVIVESLSIPTTVFTNKLGGLEGLVKYLKENLGLTYHEIAELINRNDRTIWTAYNKSVKKQPTKLPIKKTLVFIPISIFKNRKLTILEAMIVYLKDKGMKYVEIAELLGRDQRNIWTIYNRSIKK